MNRSFGNSTIQNIIKNKDDIISSSKVRRLNQVRVTVKKKPKLLALSGVPDETVLQLPEYQNVAHFQLGHAVQYDY